MLFAAGRLGVVTVEGPCRNPDSLDLMAETYKLVREQEALRASMFAEGPGLTRQSTGEGCGSVTMPLSGCAGVAVRRTYGTNSSRSAARSAPG